MELARNEILILKALKNIRESSDLELAKITGLNMDGVRRGLYFLSEKGLVRIFEEKKISYKITEMGIDAIKNGMPEEKITKYKYLKELPKDLFFILGQLKQAGYLKVENGKIVILKNIDGLKIMNFKKAIDNVDIINSFDKELIQELLRRGYLKEEKLISINASITEKGILYEIDETFAGKLTRKMLENNEWKNLTFRHYVIKENEVEEEKCSNEHPLNIAINNIRQIFLSMGFKEMTGNYVETSFWNFDALYQPQDHPSRELADTFFLPFNSNEKIPDEILEKAKVEHEAGWKQKWKIEEAKKAILRTHTTVLSARTLAKYKRGKFFAIGRVFRNEAVDYKHLAEFHQVEGIVADENVNFRHLLGILKEFFTKLGFPKIRFRPSFFPYTEPSLEIEVYFDKKNDWIEIGGAGIFRREVSRILNCTYPVLAFGLSLERPLMMLAGLDDIREFYNNDFSIYDIKYEF
ncbi:MAG: phenylalanine--tRNA ligase subunit alpha [Candidatus Anstonellales archaeon]